MKVITLYQPWATLWVIQEKKIETRSWWTSYRGPLAVHSSLNRRFCDPKSKDYICSTKPFYEVLTRAMIQALGRHDWLNFMPFGAIIGKCHLDGCFRIKPGPFLISDQEKAFGDYTPGRFMWTANNMEKLEKPIFVKGKMGLWEWNGVPE